MASDFPLLQLQQACATRLDDDAWFDAIPVITENLGDIATIVDIAVGKLGSCVVVETPVANIDFANIGGVWFNKVPIVVTVWETVIINRSTGGSLKQALETAHVIVALLKGFIPEGFNIINPSTPTIVKADSDGAGVVGYHVMFTTSIGYEYKPTRSLSTETSEHLLTEAGVVLTTEG